MNAPLVSLVIPVFNGGAFLRETLAAVYAQTHPALEVIAVDDGSTDDSRTVLREFQPRLQLLTSPNGGGSRARNLGFARVRGIFVVFLDQDDVCAPDRVARQVALLERHPADDLVVCDGREFDAGGTRDEHLLHPEIVARLAAPGAEADGVRLGIYRTLLRQQPLKTIGQCLFRRTAFARVGSFCEDRGIAPDHEWFLRHARGGGEIRFHADRLLAKRYHAASRSGASERRPTRYAELILNSLIVHRASLPGPERRRVEHAIRRLAWNVALLCLAHGAAPAADERAFAREIIDGARRRLPSHAGLKWAAAWLAGGPSARLVARGLRTGLKLKRRLTGVRPLAT